MCKKDFEELKLSGLRKCTSGRRKIAFGQEFLSPVWWSVQFVCGQYPMVEEGVQRVPLTSDGSETETEPCDKALPKDLDNASASGGLSQGRFPATTPITPPVVGVSHRQFCDSVKGRKLPGDDSGRRSFDTLQPLWWGTLMPGSTHIPL